MRFTCPTCRADFEAPRPHGGQAVRCPSCGSEFVDRDATVVDEAGPPGAALAPGKQLGGFLLEDRIGMGAMGMVFKARQLSLDRVVALKVLPPAFATRPALVKRFHEESMALSTLNHPNVVTIIDRGNVGKIYFFVMEYVDGPPLSKLMAGPMGVKEFLRVAKGTAAALEYAHQRGIVHRDIKPSNIMLNSRGEVKIADFGLSGLVTEGRQESRDPNAPRPVRMGTPAYMSPEQLKDPLAVDGRADIYAAGVVFFEMLTGVKPDMSAYRPPSQHSEAVDPRLDPIVTKCLQADPDKRYQTAKELLEDLEKFERELARAPRCPDCGSLSPVRFEKCASCGRDLSEFFDTCPECKGKNRREVRRCLHCNVDLERGRTLISNKISLMLDQADNLRLAGQFDEALQILDEIQAVDGRAFEEQRDRAKALREKVVRERTEAGRKAYEEGRRKLQEQRFREAIALFRQVPPDIRDTNEDIKLARRLQARLAAEQRSKAITNLIVFALAFTLLLILFFFARR